MQVKLVRSVQHYPKWGLAVYVQRGDLGTQVGDSRHLLFATLTILLLGWMFELRFYWRFGVNTWPKHICTSLTASWCPHHGTCTCDREVGLSMDDRRCPLHSSSSEHGSPRFTGEA